jgi:hypothetical protein
MFANNRNDEKKGTGPICAQHPAGPSGKLDLAPFSPNDELRELLAALHEELITDAQALRLTALLREDPQARRMYIHRMVLVAGLRDGVAGGAEIGVPDFGATEGGRKNDECGMMKDECSIAQSSIHHSSFIIHHSPFSAFLVYAVATLVLAMGMLSAAMWRTPNDGGQVAQSMPSVRASLAAAPQKMRAGKITRLADCRWTQPSGPADAMAGKIELESGTLEITYDNGAKAVIEGPALYYIDADGGSLPRGKLTVCLDAVDARPRASGSKARDLGALVDVSPFAVRLPSGMANVLTGQFKVSVNHDGISHMFLSRGAVELLYPGDSPWIADTMASPGQASAYVVRGDKTYPHRLVWRTGPIPELVQSLIRSQPRTERLGGLPLDFEHGQAGKNTADRPARGLP